MKLLSLEPEKDRRNRWVLFYITFLIRMAFLLVALLKSGGGFRELFLWGDSYGYYNLGLNLKLLFSLSPGAPPIDLPDLLLRTPGYPLFLALVFLIKESVISIAVIQAVLSGFSAMLIYEISRLAGFGRRVGLGSALLFSLEPVTAITSNSILTETLFLFVFLVFLWLFTLSLSKHNLSLKRSLLLGGVLGFGILVRPVLYPYVILIIVFLFLYLFRRLTLRDLIFRVVIMLVGVYWLVFPWILRNKIAFNSWSVSSISSVHLYHSYAMPFYAYRHNIADKDAAAAEFSPKIDPFLVDGVYDLRNAPVYDRFAKEIIFQDPVAYAFFHLANTTSFFLSNGYRSIGRELGFESAAPPVNYSFVRLFLGGRLITLFDFFRTNFLYFIVFVTGAAVWLLINFLMAVGIVKGIIFEKNGTRQAFIGFFALTVFYFALTAGPEAYYKMRFPVNPLIFMLAFYGLERFLNKFPAYADR